jgi:hypothetical protein
MKVRIDPTLIYLSHLTGYIHIFAVSVYMFKMLFLLVFSYETHNVKYI